MNVDSPEYWTPEKLRLAVRSLLANGLWASQTWVVRRMPVEIDFDTKWAVIRSMVAGDELERNYSRNGITMLRLPK